MADASRMFNRRQQSVSLACSVPSRLVLCTCVAPYSKWGILGMAIKPP